MTQCNPFPLFGAQWVLRGSDMEIACIYSEAKDRNCSPAPVQSVPNSFRMCPVRTLLHSPHPSPFSPHAYENTHVIGKTPRFTSRNRGLTCSQIFGIFQNKELTVLSRNRSNRTPKAQRFRRRGHQGVATLHRTHKGTPTLVSLQASMAFGGARSRRTQFKPSSIRSEWPPVSLRDSADNL